MGKRRGTKQHLSRSSLQDCKYSFLIHNLEILHKHLMEYKDRTSPELLKDELDRVKSSIEALNAKLNEQNQRKDAVLGELRSLRDKISIEDVAANVQKLMSYLDELKALERRELEFEANYFTRTSALLAEVADLEGKLANGCDSLSLSDALSDSLNEAEERLKLAKKELGARLREKISVKRKLDDFPSPEELIQYELRSSELNSHIQEKLRQTRKYYATYNALLEIKELMLKEINLLNSISSQFQNAITSTAGRSKLHDSLDGVLKSSNQKLGKVQSVLEEEQRTCDALKHRYAAAVAEGRRSYTRSGEVQ